MNGALDRVIGVAAGLLGAAGVAASAAGAHTAPGANLGTAGVMLLVHAAALVALAIPSVGAGSVRRVAAFALLVGVCLFAGDLSARAIGRGALFPMAAPLGGLVMIAGWIIAALSYIGGSRRH